jgi:HK97 family phage major capsid protein/HK97 family phage prohead protease
MQWAFPWLLKSLDEDQRIIEGIASTPTPDRMGDIIEPKGARFSLPMPLLWQHNAHQPIGQVLDARVTAAGIQIRAQIAKGLTTVIEDAWNLIKGGLVRGFSIGIKPTEVERRKDVLGLHVKQWDWLETSCVTIPANAETSILLIKSLDTAHRAAFGLPRVPAIRPGASGIASQGTTMTISDQITALRTQLQTKHASLADLMKLETDEGLTLTTEQQTDVETLTTDVDTLGTRIKRLEVIESSSALLAAPVHGRSSTDGSSSRGRYVPHIEVKELNLPPGIGFARYVICKMAAVVSGGALSALDIAKQRYPDDPRIQTMLKAAVAAGTTTDATWAGPLVQPQNLATDFIEYLRPQTLVGKFGTGNVPSLQRVPFNIRIVGQTSGATASWVGQGVPKPVTKFDTAATTLGFTKIATISVITDELARFSSPNAETLVRNELTRAVIERMDIDFIDPAKAAVANVSPASILNGVTPITMTGSDAAAVRAALGDLLGAYLAANNNPTTAVVIVPPTLALEWSMLTNALGQPEFPNLAMNGGTLMGLPVITSQYAKIGANQLFIMVNAADVYLADDGGVSVDASREASIAMSSDPVADAATIDHVSMWQNNSLALRAERYVNWAKRRPGAAQYISVAVVP